MLKETWRQAKLGETYSKRMEDNRFLPKKAAFNKTLFSKAIDLWKNEDVKEEIVLTDCVG